MPILSRHGRATPVFNRAKCFPAFGSWFRALFTTSNQTLGRLMLQTPPTRLSQSPQNEFNPAYRSLPGQWRQIPRGKHACG
jgi:hypothetical protein